MSILGDAKEAVEFVKKMGNIELLEKLVNIRSELVELTEERNRLKEENRFLKEKKNIEACLRFDRSLYWLKGDDGNETGPFCPGCWDSEKKLARLVECNNSAHLLCKVCKQFTHTKAKPR